MSLKDAAYGVWRFITWPFRKLLQCFGCCLPTPVEPPPEQKAVEEKKKLSLNPALIQAFPPRRGRRASDQRESSQPVSAPIWTLTRTPPREPATAPPIDHDIDPYMRRLEEIEQQLNEMSRKEHKRQRIAYRSEIMRKIEQEKRKQRPPSPQFQPYDSDSDKESNRVER